MNDFTLWATGHMAPSPQANVGLCARLFPGRVVFPVTRPRLGWDREAKGGSCPVPNARHCLAQSWTCPGFVDTSDDA